MRLFRACKDCQFNNVLHPQLRCECFFSMAHMRWQDYENAQMAFQNCVQLNENFSKAWISWAQVLWLLTSVLLRLSFPTHNAPYKPSSTLCRWRSELLDKTTWNAVARFSNAGWCSTRLMLASCRYLQAALSTISIRRGILQAIQCFCKRFLQGIYPTADI